MLKALGKGNVNWFDGRIGFSLIFLSLPAGGIMGGNRSVSSIKINMTDRAPLREIIQINISISKSCTGVTL